MRRILFIVAGLSVFSHNAWAQSWEEPRLRQGVYLGGTLAGSLGGALEKHVHNAYLLPAGSLLLHVGEIIERWGGLGFFVHASGGGTQHNRFLIDTGLGFESQILWRDTWIFTPMLGFSFHQSKTNTHENIQTGYGPLVGFQVGYACFEKAQLSQSGGFVVSPTIGLMYSPVTTLSTVEFFVGIDLRYYKGLDKMRLQGEPR